MYAYIPTTPELCAEGIPRVECNDHYGTSLYVHSRHLSRTSSLTKPDFIAFPPPTLSSRGSFVFPTGEWSKISLFVQLNQPASAHNGIIQIYFNGDLALSHDNLQIRASDEIYEGGLWFSSFFGGGNSSWASPKDQVSSRHSRVICYHASRC